MEMIIFYIISFFAAAASNIYLRRQDENIHLIPIIWAIPYVNFVAIIVFTLHRYEVIDVSCEIESIYNIVDEDTIDDLFQ